jgi:hypothetical protein
MSRELPSPPPPPPLLSIHHDDDNNHILDHRTDLGNIGWRFGNTMVMKVSNDKHGKRGTKAR